MTKKTLIINVTANDIAQGNAADCIRCPIARAISRHLPACGFRMIRVLPYAVRFRQFKTKVGQKDCRIELPPAAQDFISHFDMARPTQPFKFKLELP